MRQIVATAVFILSMYLGIRDGNVALFQRHSEEPVAVYSMQVSMLPERDRQALREGIPIHSRLQLAQLLEDYLS